MILLSVSLFIRGTNAHQKIPWKLTREFPFITSLHRVKLRLKEIKTDFPKTSKEMQNYDEP